MASSTDPCLIPAGPVPDGEHSDFDNPPSLAPAMMTVLSLMIAWSTIFTASRFYVNIRKLGWGDYFALIALLLATAILGILATQLRTARHIWDVPACFLDARFAKNGIYFPALLLNMGSFFAKASIFLLFLQIFTVHKPMRFAIWTGLAFNFLLYFPGIVIVTYYGTPRPGETWVDVLDGRALTTVRWWQAQSALTVVLDVYIFVLPLPAIFRLNMPTRKRVPVVAVFSLALMGIGASIASLVERVQSTHSNDLTWIPAVFCFCSSVELNVAIIVCSAPAFASFARSHLPKFSIFSSSKAVDSEAALVEQRDTRGNSKRTTSTGVTEDSTLDHNGRYYELDDAWMLKSGVTVDQARVNGMLVDGTATVGGIMRTIDVEQEARTKSKGNLKK